MTCVCQSWIDRLWKKEYMSHHTLVEASIAFTCPEHGRIEIDNRPNPIPLVDAKDPIRQYQVGKMAEHDAKQKQKEIEDRRKHPWKYMDRSVRT